MSPIRWVVLAAVTVLAVPAAQAAAETPQWWRYVPGPPGANVAPVAVVSSAGDVDDPEALTANGSGVTTLTMTAGGVAPTILLDYGKDVGGLPYFTVTKAAGDPILRAGYSEAGEFAGPDGDTAMTSFHPHAGLDPKRYDDYRVTGPEQITAQLVQGGERFERLTLTTPGSVTLSAVGVRFTAVRATPADYRGWFLSSDDQLNRIWYAGAYTTQLDMAPAGSVDGGPRPVVFDGAKRDRLVWSADLLPMIPVVADSLGADSLDYMKQSIALLGAGQDQRTGAVPGYGEPTGTTLFYSASYSTAYVHDMAEYYRYSGDSDFVRQQYQSVRRELAYDQSLVSPATGLLVTDAGNGMDWGYYDGPRKGAVTEYNVVYYRALTEAAYLADGLGESGDAADYRGLAAELRDAINRGLFDAATGTYDISDGLRGPLAQDANVAAVAYGVAPPDKVAGILDAVRDRLRTPRGTLPFTADAGYVSLISPYVGGIELAARFGHDDTAAALALLRAEWGPMVEPGPDYTGALWENVTTDGGPQKGSTSLAHGWSTEPTAQLTGSVLGVRPVLPGYRTWTIAPHPGDLAWVRGRVPTPSGPIDVNWSGRSLTVDAPAGTTGAVTLPVPADARTIEQDGRVVWRAGAAAPEATSVSFPGVVGRHVWTW
jgi:hypothetical protein